MTVNPRLKPHEEASLLLPAASDEALAFELDFLVLVSVSAAVLAIVGGLILWFCIRYRAGAARSAYAREIPNPRRIEIAWISVLVVAGLVLATLGAGAHLFPAQRRIRAHPIYVVGKQWMWKIQHRSGQREINELHVPLGEPTRLLLSSQDVIHSFFIPAFRVKQDALPSRFTSLTFTPLQTGVFDLYCAEYCGKDHSRMVGRVVVLRPEEFEAWLSPGAPEVEARPFLSMADAGAQAFVKFGCGACHTRDSSRMAPRLDGLFGEETKLQSGDRVIVDENYIRESMLHPNAKIVAGYPSPSDMPSVQGEISEDEINALIEFIRSIRNGWPPESPDAETTESGVTP